MIYQRSYLAKTKQCCYLTSLQYNESHFSRVYVMACLKEERHDDSRLFDVIALKLTELGSKKGKSFLALQGGRAGGLS